MRIFATHTPLRILLATAVAGALLVAGCGGSDSDGDGGSAAAGNPVDRAFVAEMIPHHESAVQMALIAQKRGASAFVKTLADDIVRTQNAEIATMRTADQRLESAGVAAGSLGVPRDMMGMDHDPSALRTATRFDRAFIQMMIPHHEGALTMSEAELAKGGDPELKELAKEILAAQKREIAAMRDHLGGSGSATPHMDDTTHG